MRAEAPITEWAAGDAGGGAAGDTGGPAARRPRRRFDSGRVLAIQIVVGALAGFAATAVWGMTGDGFFWPVWVWLGFAIPIAFHVAIRWAWAKPPGFPRRIAVQAAVSAVLFGTEVVVWALTGQGDTFWPLYSGTGYLVLLGLHAAIWGRMSPEREAALSARVDQLTRTRRGALDVQAAELRRIERDLHDGAQARLVSLSIQLGMAEDRMADQPEVAELFRRARGEASAAIAELRDLARGIAPPVLADRGLVAAVQALARRSAVPVEVDADIGERPLPVIETAAYFVVAEALTNVAKHARGATARVTLALDPERLVVTVADDGAGGADPGGGGLTGLRHRVEALDGTLAVTSPPGGGTTIRAELPCAS
jgi:signal transduction histidine kinase